MKKINIRNLIITLLCITVICLAIGFCIISARLDALKNTKYSYNVGFTKVEEFTSVKGGTNVPSCKSSIDNGGYTLNLDFVLYHQLDELAYNVTIKNKGNIKVKIIDVVSSPDYINDTVSSNSIKPVTITKTDISGKVLDPGEETTIKVVAMYNQTDNNIVKKIPYKLSLVTSSTN